MGGGKADKQGPGTGDERGHGQARMEGGGQSFSSMLVLDFGGLGPAPHLSYHTTWGTHVLRESLTQAHLLSIQTSLSRATEGLTVLGKLKGTPMTLPPEAP